MPKERSERKPIDPRRTMRKRTAVAVAVFVVLSFGLIMGVAFGTLSGFGWDTVSAICPLGALETMIATGTALPRPVVCVIVMALLVLVFGRAFCAWVCPFPVGQRLAGFFRNKKKVRAQRREQGKALRAISKAEIDGTADDPASASGMAEQGEVLCRGAMAPLSKEELRLLKSGCAVSALKKDHGKLDSRHAVLGGALLSAAVFGFPVFCLVCPVGLTFASVLLLWRLFAVGDVTASVLVVPAVLVVEAVLLRKWCVRLCPLAAFMTLFSRFTKTLTPTIDRSKCMETADGKPCAECAAVCESGINLVHPEYGERGIRDCTRCNACVDACPRGAITMPFMPSKERESNNTTDPDLASRVEA